MHHLISSFSKEKVPALSAFVDQAKEKYQENLNLYIKLVLRRPLARLLVRASYLKSIQRWSLRALQDFFQGLETLLRTTPPTEVSLHSTYTKPSLRRATSSLSSKDLKKAIDVLYKRVDKHFAGDSPSGGIAAAVGVGSGGGASAGGGEEAEVLRSVWSALEEDVGRIMEGWKGLIGRCYPVRLLLILSTPVDHWRCPVWWNRKRKDSNSPARRYRIISRKLSLLDPLVLDGCWNRYIVLYRVGSRLWSFDESVST